MENRVTIVVKVPPANDYIFILEISNVAVSNSTVCMECNAFNTLIWHKTTIAYFPILKNFTFHITIVSCWLDAALET